MKNKLPLIIGVVAMVIAIIVALVVVLGGNKDDKKEEGAVTLNLEEVSAKITENSAFAEMASEPVSKDLLEMFFQVNPENVENVVGKVPMMNVHASLYVIVEAKDGKVEDVKADLDEFCTQYEQQWERYLPEQYDLVKARKTGVKGNYAYVIIAENAGELEGMIK